ncbi:dipeptidase 1 [Calliphora vicina]|uniref:dipeptidase 1 n=1 Tax=Calliphora vicina TaxID=7373 RepID=UPI00325A7D91
MAFKRGLAYEEIATFLEIILDDSDSLENTTGFGGLPDVTEHSNIRRTISRQNSTSNSDSGGEISSIQKSKVNFNDTKSPSDATETTTVDAATKTKRKSKGSQQLHHHNSHHHLHHNRHRHGGGSDNVQHKIGRSSCVIVLTLIVALGLLAVATTLLYQHFVTTPSRNSHTQRLKIVTRILRDVPLVDGHNNFAWNVRKYAHSSLELVHVSNDINHKSMWVRPAWAQTDMERLKQGHVGVQVWSAYVPCEAQGLDAVQLALEQIDIIRRLTDMYQQDTVLVQSSADIQTAQRHGLMASLIGIEGGHAIGSSLGVLRSFYSLGARYLSLTHKCDVSWASSSSALIDTGLTQFGKAVVREMNRLGMMIDLSYSSDTTARDVLQATRAPVIFSHSGARQLCNSTRNVPDDILRLVAENGGLIMISFDSEDVTCGRQARLEDVVEHIKYIRAIAGIQHIGLGAGYDSIELPPIGLEDVSKYPELLATLLEDPNWSEEDVAMLAGKNFLRIMETVENVREFWKRAAITPIEQTEPQPKTQCTYMAS